MTAMDPQWALLFASALVFIITPGIALFYGGRERATSMVNMMMLSAGAIAVTTLVWTMWGWSLAFAGKDSLGGVVGDPMKGLLFKDSMVSDNGVFTSVNGNLGLTGGIQAVFHLACAVVAVSLITGALAGRVRYAIWLIFVALWVTFVFAPLAHMVFGGGLLSPNGAISQAFGMQVHDFAGASVLQISSAVSALAIVMIIGGHAHFPLKRFVLRTKTAVLQSSVSFAHVTNVAKITKAGKNGKSNNQNRANGSKGRLSKALWSDVARLQSVNAGEQDVTYPETKVSKASVIETSVRQPHNVPFVMFGIFLIWFGWIGLIIGSSSGISGVAGYAWVSSTITASSSMLTWGVTERLRSGCFSALGAASGVMAGLAASSATADVIAPIWSIMLGVIVGIVTSLISKSRTFTRYDDTLHIVSVNGVAAFIGLIAVGLFGARNGVLSTGDWHQLLAQLCLVAISVLYAGVLTSVIAFALEKLFGWRISEAKERKGVDLVDQGERAYDFSSIAQSRSGGVTGAVVEVADTEAGSTQMAVLTPVTVSVADTASDAKESTIQTSEEPDATLERSEMYEEQSEAQVEDSEEVEHSEPEVKTEPETEAEAEVKTEAEPDTDTETDSDADRQTEPESNKKAKTDEKASKTYKKKPTKPQNNRK